MEGGAWWAAVRGVAKSRTRLSDFTFTFCFHALEKEMATHSSILAWRIPGTGDPGGLPSVGSHRIGHDWSDLVAAAAAHALRWCAAQPVHTRNLGLKLQVFGLCTRHLIKPVELSTKEKGRRWSGGGGTVRLYLFTRNLFLFFGILKGLCHWQLGSDIDCFLIPALYLWSIQLILSIFNIFKMCPPLLSTDADFSKATWVLQ